MDRTHGIRQDVSLYVLYQVSVDFNAVSALTESGIGEWKIFGAVQTGQCIYCTDRKRVRTGTVFPVPAESREFP